MNRLPKIQESIFLKEDVKKDYEISAIHNLQRFRSVRL